MADITPALYNLRDDAGYLVYSTHDVEELVEEIDRRRETDEPVRLDDFTVTQIRDRVAEVRRQRRETAREADGG